MDSDIPDISDAALQAKSHRQLKEIAMALGRAYIGRGETRGDTLGWIRGYRRDRAVTPTEPSERRNPRSLEWFIDQGVRLVAVAGCLGVVRCLWILAKDMVWDAKDRYDRGLLWALRMKSWIDFGALALCVISVVVIYRFPGRPVSDGNVKHGQDETTLGILPASKDEYDQIRLYHQGSEHAAEVPEVPHFPRPYQDYRETPPSDILRRLARALRRLSHVQTELDESRTTSEALQANRDRLRDCLQQERKKARSTEKHTEERTTELQGEVRGLEAENRRYLKELIRLKGKVWAFARVRPKIDRDQDEHFVDLTSPSPEEQSLILRGGQFDEKHPRDTVYDFDRVFRDTDTNRTIYESIKPMVQAVMEGYDVAIILDGPSGSGKSYTMFEPPHGIAFSIAGQIFHRSSLEDDPSQNIRVRLSGFQVYKEQLQLATEKAGAKAHQQLHISDRGEVYRDTHYQTKVVGEIVSTPEQLTKQLTRILGAREQRATEQNATSSRGHMICKLDFSPLEAEGEETKKSSLFLVDLAGPERVGNSPDPRETIEINKGRTALRNCMIRAVKLYRSTDQDGAKRKDAEKNLRPDFKDSKLTHILRDCFMSQSRMVIIATANPYAAKENRFRIRETFEFVTQIREGKTVL